MTSNIRRTAREAALRVLYEVEVGGSDLGEATDRAFEEIVMEAPIADFARSLIVGVTDNRANLDQNVAGYVREYDFSRLAAIDRNILRIGAYELLFEPDVPPAVSLNEAIELAKLYSTAESSRFVNGVLARILANSPKADWKRMSGAAPALVEEVVVEEPQPEPEEEVVEEGSEEAALARKFGAWTLGGETDRVDPEP